MNLNLSELIQAMSPLSEMCKKERVVDLAGVSVTLKHLTPKEEIEVQRLLPDITENASFAMEFADVFRRETLCRAIIKINNLDLKGVETVETEEKLSSGVTRKIPRQEAVLKIIEGWSRPVISKIFEEYTILSEEIDSDLDESLKLKTEDTKATSENLKKRSEDILRAQTLESVSEKSPNEQNVL